MSALSDAVETLFTRWRREGLELPSCEVRIVESREDRYQPSAHHPLSLPRNALKSLAEYEARFDELIALKMPWLNLTCWGINEGQLILATEIPSQYRGGGRTSINYSRPLGHPNEASWDLSEALWITD